ncbi:hypothetical protein [Vagococcus proximus]|uniref:hypothetical protein n=1 Tax=Vagococcus proximus TaxID=2991417 RepID=UPI0023B7942B|nr:hypothetical protein [Vagococcus proximus]
MKAKKKRLGELLVQISNKSKSILGFALIFLVAVNVWLGYPGIIRMIVNIGYFIGIMLLADVSRHRREDRIEEMWQLANKLDLTTAELSQISTIKKMDLESTKKETISYYPPDKKVKATIALLKEHKEKSLLMTQNKS